MLIVLGAALVLGLYRGIIAQLASLGGVIIGIIAARLFSDDMGSLLMTWQPDTFTSPTWSNIAGGIIVYLIVYFCIGLFASFLRRITDTLMAGWTDHLLGGVLGVFKCMILLSFFLNFFYMVAPHNLIFTSSTLAGGQFFTAVMELAPKLFGLVAGHVGDIMPIIY